MQCIKAQDRSLEIKPVTLDITKRLQHRDCEDWLDAVSTAQHLASQDIGFTAMQEEQYYLTAAERKELEESRARGIMFQRISYGMRLLQQEEVTFPRNADDVSFREWVTCAHEYGRLVDHFLDGIKDLADSIGDDGAIMNEEQAARACQSLLSRGTHQVERINGIDGSPFCVESLIATIDEINKKPMPTSLENIAYMIIESLDGEPERAPKRPGGFSRWCRSFRNKPNLFG